MQTLLLAAAAATTAAPHQPLSASLLPCRSSHATTVVQVRQADLPAAATWLRIRPADGQPMPAAIVPDGSTANGSWFPRRQQPGGGEIQQFAFAAAEMFNAGSSDGVPPCTLTPRQTRRFTLEAWTGRADLDGSSAQLLASSGSLTFSFDDEGFSASQPFGEFTAAERGASGVVTVTAAIANATAFAQAQLVTWFGFRPLSHPPAGQSGPLPYFTIDSMLLGDQYESQH